MKTKEELAQLKEKYDKLASELTELSENELSEVTGGNTHKIMETVDNGDSVNSVRPALGSVR